MSILPRRRLFAALLAAAALSPAARAANLFWDGASTSANADGGAGTWDVSTPNWDTLAAAGADSAWVEGSDAFFAGTAGTVTVSGSFSLASLTVTGGYTLSGGTLDLGGRTLTTSATGSGTTATISSVIAGSGGLTLAANGDTSASGGGVGGALLLNGANTFSGGVTITSGVVDISSGFGAAANAVTLNGGGLVDRGTNATFARAIVVGSSGGVLRNYGGVSNAFTGDVSGTGTLRRTDSGAALFTGNWTGSVSLDAQRGSSIIAGLWQSTGTLATSGGPNVSSIGFGGTRSLGTASTYTLLASGLNQANSRGLLLDSARVVAGRNLSLNGAAVAPLLGSAALTFSGDISGVHPSYSGAITTAGNTTSRNGGFFAPGAALTVASGHTLDAFGGPVWVGSLAGAGTVSATGVGNGSTGRLGGFLSLVYAGSSSGRSGALVGRINDAPFVVGSLGSSTSFTGSLNGSAGLLKRGGGTLTLGGSGNATGTYVVEQGVLRFSGTNYSFPGSARLGSNFAVFEGGAVEAAANYPFSQGQTAYLLGGTLRYVSGDVYAPQIILDGGRIEGNGFRFGYNQNHFVNVLAARGASTIAGNISLFNNGTSSTFRVEDGSAARDLVVSGQLNDDSGHAGQRIIKGGLGTMALLSASTRSGGTTLEGGVLELAAAGALGSGSAAGITLNGGTLWVNYGAGATLASQAYAFGGGTLLLSGNTAAATQSLGAVSVGNGNATIQSSPGSGGATSVSLGSITRTGAATRAFLNLSGTAAWTTTQANDASGKLPGVLLGGALAANDGAGNIVKFAGTQLAANSVAASSGDLIIGSGVTGDLSLAATGVTSVGSLSFDGSAAGRTVAIGAGNTLRVASGLFQVTSGLAFNLSGGTLTGGSADNTAADLYIGATGGMLSGSGMTVSSVIANNGTGALTLVKGGAGSLSLTGANTFSGGLVIQQGRVVVTSDSTAGAGAITVNDGGQLYLSGTLSRAVTLNGGVGPAEGAGNLGALRLESGSTLSGTLTVSRDSRITTHAGASATLSGAVAINAALVKTGSGTLNLTAAGANNGSGTLVVAEGTAVIGTAGSYNSASYDGYVAPGATLRFIGINSWQGNLITVAAGGLLDISGGSGSHGKFRNINLLGGTWLGSGSGKFAGEDGGFVDNSFSLFVGGTSRSLVETPNKIAFNDTRVYVQDATANSAPDLLVRGSFVGTGYLGGLGTTRFERRVGSAANSNHTATLVVQAGHTLELGGAGAIGTGSVTLDGGRLRATSLDGLAEHQLSGGSLDSSSTGGFTQVTTEAVRANSTADFGANTTWSYRGRLVLASSRTIAFQEAIDDAAWVRVWGTSDAGASVDQVILNNATWNATTTGSITLAPGTYNLDVRAWNGGGGAGGTLRWDLAGGTNWTAVGATSVAGVRLLSPLGLSQTISNNLALNRRSEVEVLESADTLTLSGVVSGAGMLEKTGAGALVLSAANTFSGGLTVAGGTVRVDSLGSLGAGAVNLLGGSTLVYSGASSATFSNFLAVEQGNATLSVTNEAVTLTLARGVDNHLSGAATRDLTKTGAGTLVVGGASTGNHRLVVQAGTVSVTSTDASRASASVSAGATLSVASASFGAIASAGAVTAASTSLGALTVTGGSLAAANAATVGALTVSNGTLSLAVAGAAGNLQVSGGVLSASSLATAGTIGVTGGSASLGAVSAGATTLSDGTLSLAGGATLASLATTGGSLLVAGAGVGGQLNVTGNVALGGVARFDLTSSPSSGNDRIVAGGSLDLLGLTQVNLNLLGGSLSNGEYVLVSAAGGVTEPLTGLAGVAITGVAAGGSRQTIELSSAATPNALSLVVAGSVASLTWTNAAGDGLWRLRDAVLDPDDTVPGNWQAAGSPGGLLTQFYAGDAVAFADLAGVPAETVSLVGDLSPGSVTFANTAATTYTLAGDGALVGVTGLVVSGGGRVVLANTGTNAYSGATTLTSGILELGRAGALSSASAVSVAGGTLDVAAVASASAGAVTLSSGTITGAAGSLAASSLVVTGGLLDANLAGPGTLRFEGSGTTFAYGRNAAHTGGTTLASGTLNLTGSVNGALSVSSGALLNLSGSVGGSLTLAVGASADIAAGGSASAGVVLAGSLSGGSTLASAGSIAGGASVGRNSTLTSSGSLAGGATISAGGLLVSSGSLAGAVANSGTLRFAGSGDVSSASVISGGSLVEKTGSGTVTLSGQTHAIATLALQQGRLVVNTGSGATWQNTLNTANLTLASGTTLAFGSNTSLNGNLSFAGDSSLEVASGVTVWKDTSGTLGTNSAGATVRKTGAGTLVIGTNVMGFGAGASFIVEQGTLQLNRGSWYNGNIMGSAALTVSAQGTVNITASHVFDAFSGQRITVNGGQVISTTNSGAYLGSLVMTGGLVSAGFNNILTIETLASASTAVISGYLGHYDRAFTATVADGAAPVDLQIASTNQAFTKAGPGWMQVVGGATTRDITVSAGTLEVGSGGTAGAVANVSVASGASLRFNRSDDVAHASALSGAGSVTHAGSGKLTLSGANTFTGGLDLAGGTLALGSAQSGGTGPLTVSAANATLEVGSGISASFAAVGGVGSLTKSGAGTLALSGSNALGGSLAVSAGALSLSGAGSLGNAGAVSVSLGAALSVGSAVADSGSAAITNAGTLTMAGSTSRGLVNSGVAVVTGSLTGQTTLTGGTLSNSGTLGAVAQSGGALASTGVVGDLAASGGALSLSGTVGALSLSGTGVLNVAGIGATGALSASSLALLDGARLELEVSDPTSAAYQDRILLAGGALDLSGIVTGVTIDVFGLNRATGERGGATVFNRYADYTVNLIGGAGIVTGDLSALIASNLVVLNATGFGDGLEAAGTWSLQQAADGINLVYEGLELPLAVVTVGSGLTESLADSTAGADFLAGDANVVLVKAGDGRLSVTESLAHVGGTRVDAGVLLLSGSGASLAQGAVTLASGAELELDLDGALANNVDGSGLIRKVGVSSVALSGILANAGGISVDAGSLAADLAAYSSTATLTVASGATVELLGAEVQTLSAEVAGAGTFLVGGSRIVTLSASSPGFSGLIDVQSGGVVLAADQAAGSGTVQVASGASLQVSGARTLGSLITGAGSLAKTGSGVATLSVAPILSGAVSVNAGTLRGDFTSVSGAISVAAGATLDYSVAGSAVRGAADITGAGSLAKTGAGTLTLSSSLGLTGAVRVEEGTLAAADFGSASSVAVSAGAVAALAPASDITLATAFTGAGTLRKLGASSLTVGATGLSGFGGKVQVVDGTLALGSTSSLGAISGSDAIQLDAATLSLGNGANLASGVGIQLTSRGGRLSIPGASGAATVAGPISGSGQLELAGAGNTSDTGGGDAGLGLRLANVANTFVGDVRVTAGLVSYASAGSFGDAANRIVLDGGGLLDNNQNISLARDLHVASGGGLIRLWGATAVTYSGALTGAGQLRRTDTGSLTLTGDLSGFTGNFVNLGNSTTVLSGSAPGLASATLTLSSGTVGLTAGRLGSAALSLDGGTLRLDASGTYSPASASLVAGKGATINVGSGVAATLAGGLSGTATTLTQSGNGTLVLGGSASATLTSSLSLAGTLQLAGQSLSTPSLTVGGGATLRVTSGSLTSTAAQTYVGTGTLTVDGGVVTLTGLRTGEGSGTASVVNLSAGTLNINGGVNAQGDGRFNSFILSHWGSTTSVNISGGTLNSLNTVLYQGWDGTSAISQTGGTVNLLGIGSTQRANGATYSLTGGRLNLGSTGWVASGSRTLTAGDATLGALADHTIAVPVALTGSAGTVVATTDAADGVTGRTITLSGALSGSGRLLVSGAGTAVLSGANTNSGLVRVDSGTLLVIGTLRGGAALEVASGATLQLDAVNIFAAGHGVALAPTQSIVANGGTVVLGSAFDARLGNLTLNGATLTSNRGLDGYDAFIADTTAGAAVVTVGGSGASVMNGTGGIHLGTGVRFDVADATGSAAADLTVSLRLDGGGFSGGAGSLVKEGAGTMVLTGANTFTGGITVSAGTLEVGGSGTLGGGSFAGAIANSGALVFSTSANQTLSGVLSGGGSLLKSGAGVLTLGAANTHSGSTSVANGTLRLGAAGNLSSSASVDVGASGTLDLNGRSQTLASLTGSGAVALGSGALTLASDTDGAFAGTISGSGSLTKSGAGTLTLGAANSYTGATTVSAGTLRLGSAASLASGSLSVGPEGTFDLNGRALTLAAIAGEGVVSLGSGSLTVANAADVSFAGVISGSGSLAKSEAGTLTLAGANTHSGATTVSAGSLVLAHQSALGASTLTLAGGSAIFSESVVSNAFSLGGLAGTADLALDNDGLATGPVALTVGGNNASTAYSGVLSGSGSLTKAGNGVLALSGANSFSGGLVVDGGRVDVSSLGALGTGGVTLGASGALRLALALDSAASLSDLAGASDGSGLSGPGILDLALVGDGPLSLGLYSDFGGSVRLTSGVFDNSGFGGQILFAGGRLLDLASYSGTVTVAGAITDLSLIPLSAPIVLQEGGSIDFGDTPFAGEIKFRGGSVSGDGFTGTLVVDAPEVTLSGSFGQGTLQIGEGSTVTLSGPTSGTVVFQGGAIEGGANLSGRLELASGASLVLGSSLDSLSSSVTVAIAPGTAVDLSGSATAASLEFTGGSLAGAENFTGTLAVAGGATLETDGTVGGTVVLAPGTVLAGNGTFTGTVNVGDGSTLAPGSSPGLVTVDGGVLNLTGGSAVNLEFFSQSETVVVDGQNRRGYDSIRADTLNFGTAGDVGGGKILLRLATLANWSDTVDDWTGTEGKIPLAGSSLIHAPGELKSFVIARFDLSDRAGILSDGLNVSHWFDFETDLYDGTDATFSSLRVHAYVGDDSAWMLSMSMIPEPSTYGLVLGGLALAGAALRRRRPRA